MNTTPDRRVRRTRAALLDALLDLISEKGYEAITVADLIDRADVGRSTFYSHYTDKDDLLEDGLATLRSLIDASATGGTTAGVLRFSLPFLRHIDVHRRLARALLGHHGRGGRNGLLPQIESILADIVRAEFAALPVSRNVPAEALVRFVVGAYTALLQWWLDSPTPVTPEELDRMARALMEPAIGASARPSLQATSAAAPTGSSRRGTPVAAT